jgi:hypothetical protein
VIAVSTQSRLATTKPAIFQALAAGTVAVALLDATDGVVFYWLTAHKNPIQVLQYIASGAFGAAAYDGGLATAFAGLLLHVGISAVVAGAFVAAYLRWPAVREHAIALGLVYGAAVWAFMNLAVLPHTGAAGPISSLQAANGLIGHALFVGLPAALASRRFIGASAA